MKHDAPHAQARRRDETAQPNEGRAAPAGRERPAAPNPAHHPPQEGPSVTTIGTIGEILADADPRRSFGPMFFASQLRVFVRDCCGGSDDYHPNVQVLLADGAVFDLCHVIGVASGWVALAVRDEDHPKDESRRRTELVPYRAIERVTIRPSRDESGGIGFSHRVEPQAIGVAHMTPVSAGAEPNGQPTNGSGGAPGPEGVPPQCS